MKKQKSIIIILIILLVAAVIYIAYVQIQEHNKEQAEEIYKRGMEAGYEAAVKQLFEEASTCQPVAVHAKNITINVIPVECLQQTPQEMSIIPPSTEE